jgi:hypothetical protein
LSTDVSEEHIASIVRVEETISARNQQASSWRYIPEVDTLLNHRCENLKSYRTLKVQQQNTKSYPDQDSLLHGV